MSYSFSLELEISLSNALEDASSALTPQILQKPSGPSLFTVVSITSTNSMSMIFLEVVLLIHTSHGIMLQNIPSVTTNSDIVNDQPVIKTVPKTGERSLKSFKDDRFPHVTSIRGTIQS